MRSLGSFVRAILGGAALLAAAACAGDDGEAPIAFDLDRDLVYVTDEGGAVHVFDAGTFSRVGEIEFDGAPSEVHATPDGALVWVLNGPDNTVTLIDTATRERTTVVVGVGPVHSGIAPGYGQIWVGNDGSSSVSVIDLASRSLVETLLTGDGHHKLAFATDDGGELAYVYVSNISGSITPVQADRAVLPNVSGVGPAPHGIDYAASTTFVYNCSGDVDPETAGEQPGIEVIATRDDGGTAEDERHTVVERIALPTGRCGYLHVESSDAAFFTIGATGELGRLALPSHEVELFEVGGRPDKFAIVGDRAYVVDVFEPVVTVVDLEGDAPNETIATGQPVDPASTPDGGHRSLLLFGDRLYVPNGFDGTVTVVDTTDDAVVGTLDGMQHPVNVAVAGPSGGSTYPR